MADKVAPPDAEKTVAAGAPSQVREQPAAQAKFLTGDLMGHVATMSFAASIGLMAIFLVDLADLYFISLLGEAELAAAVGYAGAILFFTTSISIGFAIATGALTARALGAGEPERARRVMTHAIAAALALSFPIVALVYAFIPDLVALIGAKGRTAELAEAYLRIVTPSLPFMFCIMSGGAVLRAHGDARRAMNTTLTAAAVNAVLDPLLIFGLGPIPGFGLEGAAAATVLARIAGAIVAFLPIFTKYGGFARIAWGPLQSDIRPIAALAFPAMLTNVATPVGAAFVTRQIAEFGDGAVAGYAIIGRLTPVAFAVVFALSGALGPIVGQNFGAQRFDRVRAALTNGLIFLGVYVLIVSLVLLFIRDGVVDAFGAGPEATELIFWFCGPLALAFFFNGALFASNAAFNNLGRPFVSTGFNWARHTLGTIPLALLGAWALGAPGVLIGQAAGGAVFGVWAVWRAYRLIDAHAAGDVSADARPRLGWRHVMWPFSSPKA